MTCGDVSVVRLGSTLVRARRLRGGPGDGVQGSHSEITSRGPSWAPQPLQMAHQKARRQTGVRRKRACSLVVSRVSVLD